MPHILRPVFAVVFFVCVGVQSAALFRSLHLLLLNNNKKRRNIPHNDKLNQTTHWVLHSQAKNTNTHTSQSTRFRVFVCLWLVCVCVLVCLYEFACDADIISCAACCQFACWCVNRCLVTRSNHALHPVLPRRPELIASNTHIHTVAINPFVERRPLSPDTASDALFSCAIQIWGPTIRLYVHVSNGRAIARLGEPCLEIERVNFSADCCTNCLHYRRSTRRASSQRL